MEKIKRKIIYWLAKNLLPITEPKDIIAFDKQGGVYINGEKQNQAQLNSLRAEAAVVLETKLWKLINDYFIELTKKKMFVESKDITDLIFGKTVLYTLEVQKQIVESVKKAKDPK